jgi:type IV pilus assembly protein PilF
MIIIIMNLIGCATSEKDREKADLYLQMGTSNLEKGNYPAALKNLLSAEEYNPNDPLIQNNLGLAYFVRDRNELAEKHMQRALAIKSDFTEARINLGRVYMEQKKYDEAIRILHVATQDLTYPNPEKAWTQLGMAQFSKGDFNSAKKSLAEAIKINRQNCTAFSFFGRSLYELHDYSGAAEQLDRAIQVCLGSDFDDPYYFSGLSYYKLGEKEKATARFEQIKEKFPESKYSANAQSLLKVMK